MSPESRRAPTERSIRDEGAAGQAGKTRNPARERRRAVARGPDWDGRAQAPGVLRRSTANVGRPGYRKSNVERPGCGERPRGSAALPKDGRATSRPNRPTRRRSGPDAARGAASFLSGFRPPGVAVTGRSMLETGRQRKCIIGSRGDEGRGGAVPRTAGCLPRSVWSVPPGAVAVRPVAFAYGRGARICRRVRRRCGRRGT